jgi:hypothetical protein
MMKGITIERRQDRMKGAYTIKDQKNAKISIVEVEENVH